MIIKIDSVIRNGGGTFNKAGRSVHLRTGFMVSLKKYGQVIPLDHCNSAFISINADDFPKAAFVGLWVDGGLLYVDASLQVKDLHKALHLAEREEQLAIWDNRERKEIRLH